MVNKFWKIHSYLHRNAEIIITYNLQINLLFVAFCIYPIIDSGGFKCLWHGREIVFCKKYNTIDRKLIKSFTSFRGRVSFVQWPCSLTVCYSTVDTLFCSQLYINFLCQWTEQTVYWITPWCVLKILTSRTARWKIWPCFILFYFCVTVQNPLIDFMKYTDIKHTICMGIY